MTINAEKRKLIREAYHYCCGYCGVSELSVGNELDIDHFQPSKHDGTDNLENLVYVCPGCNRFKGEYWPKEVSADSFHLLNPVEDDFSTHIAMATNGRLIGLTPRGWFHIQWLHLNRPQLIAFRQQQQQESELKNTLAQAESTQNQLREQIHILEQEVAALQEVIARLTS